MTEDEMRNVDPDDEPEDELTEQMIAAIAELKSQFQQALSHMESAQQRELRSKDETISSLSSQISTLESKVLSLTEKIESLNRADLVLSENGMLRDEIRRQKESNERIQGLLGRANELRQAAKDFPEAIDAMRRAEKAVERSNETVRVELSEATEKAAQGIIEPITAHFAQLNQEARNSLFINAFSKWTAAILCLLFIGSAAFVGYKLNDTREALGRVGTAVNHILQIEKTRQGGQ